MTVRGNITKTNNQRISNAKTLLQNCIELISEIIDEKQEKITNRGLLKICEKIDFLKNEANPHLGHELAETAVNLLVKRKYANELLSAVNPAKSCQEILKPLMGRLPTQTWRSKEQNKWQQFSTPPPMAYLLAYLLNFQPGEVVLEPSAGTGSLAVWANCVGVQVHTNEIDSRRRELLEFLGFTPTSYNAEFINDYLPGEIEPNCLIMNPPFSSNGGRTHHNSSKYGFRHVESALERLKKGGKFGIILGNSAGLDTKNGREFWQKLSGRIGIKTIIKIAGKEYAKNGTRVDVNLIIGTKYQEAQEIGCNAAKNAIIGVSANSIEEGFAVVQKLNLRLD